MYQAIKYLSITSSACLLLFCLFGVAGCATFGKERGEAWDLFVYNGQLVSNAKRAYQMGHNMPDGTEVGWEDLATCLPGGWKPVCLKGGTIKPGKLGEGMTCTYHGTWDRYCE